MQSKTSAIVLHTVRYSDSSYIVTFFTQQHGRLAVLVRAVNSKKSTVKPAYFQHLTLVDVDVSIKPGRELHTLKDIRIEQVLQRLSSSPVKNAIALFLSEVLFKTLRHSEPDSSLFEFVRSAVISLNEIETHYTNFHLCFLLKLSVHFGFAPHFENSDFAFFDFIQGEFVATRPLHKHVAMRSEMLPLMELATSDFNQLGHFDLDRKSRTKLLAILMEYYSLHLDGFRNLNSPAVLQALFD